MLPSPMKYALVLIASLLVAAPRAGAQDPAESRLLAWTTEVGRMLHGYHAALDVAAAAVGGHAEAPPALYAGGPYDDGWAFSFGEVEGDSAFVIRYGVIVRGDGVVARLDVFDHRRVASPYHALAARALAVVRDAFARLRREASFTAESYRYAVLPFPDGQLTAFVSPAQTRPGVTLMGNDVMYTLDRAGVFPSAVGTGTNASPPAPTGSQRLCSSWSRVRSGAVRGAPSGPTYWPSP